MQNKGTLHPPRLLHLLSRLNRFNACIKTLLCALIDTSFCSWQCYAFSHCVVLCSVVQAKSGAHNVRTSSDTVTRCVSNRVSVNLFAGFNLTTFTLLGNNRTVRGLVSEVPASSLQAVQPEWSSSLTHLNLTVRAQGPAILPFTAALQRELVSALLRVS